MKIKQLTLLIACTILAVASGCTTATKTGQNVSACTHIPTANKVEYDINMKEKKSGTATSSYLFGFIKLSGPSTFAETTAEDGRATILGNRIDKLRLAALHNAIQTSSGDRLVDPQYDCKVYTFPFGLFRKYTVTVKGYEATIKDIHPVKN